MRSLIARGLVLILTLLALIAAAAEGEMR